MAKYRWLVALVCLIAAFASYGVGFEAGVGLFILIGACLELAFWFNIFKYFEKPANGNSSR